MVRIPEERTFHGRETDNCELAIIIIIFFFLFFYQGHCWTGAFPHYNYVVLQGSHGNNASLRYNQRKDF